MGLSAVMGDIDQIFHQVLVQNKNRDVLRSLRRDNYIDSIEDYYMTFHLFGKVTLRAQRTGPLKKLQIINLILLTKFPSKT